MSRHLRRELESVVDGAGVVATVVEELRAELKGGNVDPGRRRAAVRAVAEAGAVWAVARANGSRDAVREAADGVLADALGDDGDGG